MIEVSRDRVKKHSLRIMHFNFEIHVTCIHPSAAADSISIASYSHRFTELMYTSALHSQSRWLLDASGRHCWCAQVNHALLLPVLRSKAIRGLLESGQSTKAFISCAVSAVNLTKRDGDRTIVVPHADIVVVEAGLLSGRHFTKTLTR